MGILFGDRPRLTDINDTNDLENYGLSFIGNGDEKLEKYNDIQVPLQAIRRSIIAHQDPINVRFIMDYS
jgi:hypothetical protein